MSVEYGNAEKLVAIYNELDAYMEKSLSYLQKEAPYGYARRIDRLSETGNKTIQTYRALLKSYGELRNAIVHDYKGDERIIAQPMTEEVLKFEELKNIVINPPRAFEKIVIRSDEMYKVKPGDKVSSVMDFMVKNRYSYAPVMENAKLLGVFSQDTLFSHIANTSEYIFDDNTLIKEFGSLIELDKHTCETFKFAPKTATVFDIDFMFKDEIMGEKRLEVLFITEHGRSDEQILGLTTIWDIAAYKSKANI